MNFLHRLWLRLTPRQRDTAARAFKTFVQAFLAVAVPAVVALPAVSVAALVTIVTAAAASAISVVWNTVVKPALPETIVVRVPDDLLPE